eukprot:comp91289_c0_seq1/m.48560 comp91289_c0_seq1/g.48560  ORF comp91289_c0_seq1/g.48560 comp91289_c0_seq1/m.48560 type:complete len:349 (-) comp91289_c0_seq1:15-1061(-)
MGREARRKNEERSRSGRAQRKKGDRYDLSRDEASKFSSQLQPLGLRLKEVLGDGNCLFRAFADQIEGDEEQHAVYRRKVVEYMKAHRADFEPFVEDDVPFDKHISDLAEDGTFGGNDSIVAFARLMGVNVSIHQLDAPRWNIATDNDTRKPVVHLAYHNYEHYSSVRPSDSGARPKAPPVVIPKKKPLQSVPSKPPEDRPSATEQRIMTATGNQDLDLIRSILEDCGGDEECAVDMLCQIGVGPLSQAQDITSTTTNPPSSPTTQAGAPTNNSEITTKNDETTQPPADVEKTKGKQTGAKAAKAANVSNRKRKELAKQEKKRAKAISQSNQPDDDEEGVAQQLSGVFI